MKKEEILKIDCKGYDFKNGNNVAVLSNRRYKLELSIPDHLFLLHQCSFDVEVCFNKKIRGYASFPDFFDSLLKTKCNLRGHLDIHSAKTCKVFLKGKGLNPDIIRQLLYKKCDIKSITAVHIEVKAFPHPHASSLFIHALTQLNIPFSRTHKQIKYDFSVKLNEYDLWCYELTDGTSYGKNLELWYKGKVSEQDFRQRVEAMVLKILDYYSFQDLRSIDDVLSPTNRRPSGIMIETLRHRNRELAMEAHEQIQSKIMDMGIVTQEDFERAYSYLGNKDSVNKRKFEILGQFNLARHSFTTDPSVVSWFSPDFIEDRTFQEPLLPFIDFSMLDEKTHK